MTPAAGAVFVVAVVGIVFIWWITFCRLPVNGGTLAHNSAPLVTALWLIRAADYIVVRAELDGEWRDVIVADAAHASLSSMVTIYGMRSAPVHKGDS